MLSTHLLISSLEQPCDISTIIILALQVLKSWGLQAWCNLPRNSILHPSSPKSLHIHCEEYLFSVCVHRDPTENISDGKWTILHSCGLLRPLFSPTPMLLSALFLHFGLISTLPLTFFFFSPKANMPCETSSTGFQVGTTATMRQVRPCRMTRWQPSAAPYMKWSPRTWRTPRPYGMPAALRSWLASPKAKEISKSKRDFVSL